MKLYTAIHVLKITHMLNTRKIGISTADKSSSLVNCSPMRIATVHKCIILLIIDKWHTITLVYAVFVLFNFLVLFNISSFYFVILLYIDLYNNLFSYVTLHTTMYLYKNKYKYFS